jgi:hypothetical protein
MNRESHSRHPNKKCEFKVILCIELFVKDGSLLQQRSPEPDVYDSFLAKFAAKEQELTDWNSQPWRLPPCRFAHERQSKLSQLLNWILASYDSLMVDPEMKYRTPIVLFGDGRFKTGGWASNIGGAKSFLSRFLPVIEVSEYNTSKKSCCCQVDVERTKSSRLGCTHARERGARPFETRTERTSSMYSCR